MTLLEAVDAYVGWRRAHGARFITSAWLLRRFCTHVGGDIDCGAVREEDVLGFLAGNGPLTRYRAGKRGTLAGVPALRDQPRPRRPVAASRAR